jgi:DNA polymerase-3 subunit gamma/tau
VPQPATSTNGQHPPQEAPPEPAEEPVPDAAPLEPAAPAEAETPLPDDTQEAAPPPDEQQTAAAQAVREELTLLDQVEALWSEVVRDVRPHDITLQAMLRDVHPVNVEGNTVVLLAKSAFHQSQIEKPHRRQIVEKVLARHLDQRLAVRCIVHEQEKPDDLRQQMRHARNDPHVKAARNIFGAQVIAIEPVEE